MSSKRNDFQILRDLADWVASLGINSWEDVIFKGEKIGRLYVDGTYVCILLDGLTRVNIYDTSALIEGSTVSATRTFKEIAEQYLKFDALKFDRAVRAKLQFLEAAASDRIEAEKVFRIAKLKAELEELEGDAAV